MPELYLAHPNFQTSAFEVQRILEANEGFGNRAHLGCFDCGEIYPTDKTLYDCVRHDPPGLLEVKYDFGEVDPEELKALWKLRKTSNKPYDRSGVWRFRELLPFVDDPKDIVTLEEGNTPLFEAPACAEYAGVSRLLVKHLGLNPTGSFKDPGMTTAMTKAKMEKMKAAICASTGNTSASAAAYAERAGLVPIVLIPEGQISYSKLSQSLDYGALTIQIEGNFDKAMELVMKIAPQLGIYIVNSKNPFRLEGQKTTIAEILEQLNWEVPDRIILPVGNAGNLSSLYKGLIELKMLGFINRLPRLTGVQAAGAAPLYNTIAKNPHPFQLPGRLQRVRRPDTAATAIKIGDPVSWKKATQGIWETDGWITTVTEQEIADAKAVAGRDGLGCEPASATTIAGLKKLMREGTDRPIDPDEKVVAIFTGNMLKDTGYANDYHQKRLSTTSGAITSNFANQPVRIKATEKALAGFIEKALRAA